MINELEVFGIALALFLSYFIVRKKEYKLLIFGLTLLPFGLIWESVGVNYAWQYTTPSYTSYSFYITQDIPLIIPLGWSLSMMLLSFLWQRMNKKRKQNISLLFVMGFVWGTLFELAFVKLGYWIYIIDPIIAGIRPNVPIGWGLLAMSLIGVFEILWKRLGGEIFKKPAYLLVFLAAYAAMTPIIIIFMSFVSVNLINPICMATLCS